MEIWLEALERFGIATVIVAALGLGAALAARWAAREIWPWIRDKIDAKKKVDEAAAAAALAEREAMRTERREWIKALDKSVAGIARGNANTERIGTLLDDLIHEVRLSAQANETRQNIQLQLLVRTLQGTLPVEEEKS